MKILIIGRLDGWMGVYMNQYAAGYRLLNHDVKLIDYHDLTRKRFCMASVFGQKGCAQIQERSAQLIQLVQAYQPEFIVFTGANLKFDFSRLRDSLTAKLVYYDMDGPAASYFKDDLTWIHALDLLVTISKAVSSRLYSQGFSQVRYLPHGVDTRYYAPIDLKLEEQKRFSASISFVGRSSERRIKLLSPLVKQGLVVWGKRWSKKPATLYSEFQHCVRERRDVIGEELNQLYNGANVVLNILRCDEFSMQNTMLNIQSFAVPSAAACLITEWVEELNDIFDVGEEVLAFKTADELVELVNRYAKDLRQAKKIGVAGRKRCIANHTHRHRANALLQYFC